MANPSSRQPSMGGLKTPLDHVKYEYGQIKIFVQNRTTAVEDKLRSREGEQIGEEKFG